MWDVGISWVAFTCFKHAVVSVFCFLISLVPRHTIPSVACRQRKELKREGEGEGPQLTPTTTQGFFFIIVVFPTHLVLLNSSLLTSLSLIRYFYLHNQFLET